MSAATKVRELTAADLGIATKVEIDHDRIILQLTQQQYDTLLAGMRTYQHGLDEGWQRALNCRDEIATGTGERPLTADEIDDLIEDWQTETPSDVGTAG